MKVKSILDTDLYLFSVSYYFIKQYPDASGTLAFNDRNKTEYTEEELRRLKSELHDLTSLELKKEEMEWCKKNIPYIPEIYWEWLRGFRFEYDRINLWLDSEKHLHIEVTDKLYKTALYEIPILATVSGIMHEPELVGVKHSEVLGRLAKKVEMINTFGLKVGDMGCRRRASYEIQEEVVGFMAKNIQPELFTGTSNVYLAKKFGVKPLGTMSHFMVMFNMAHHGYRMGNYYTMETWADTYHGDLGIYLTDTVGSEAFFKNFSKKHAKLFDGIRQDSGDEYKFVDRAVERYKELGINPLTKTIVFSNALTVEKYKDIAEYCKGKIMCSAGIGTSLTCDVPGVKPCNIVMKLKECRMNDNQTMIPCIKLSDDLGKHTGDIEEVRRAKETLGIDSMTEKEQMVFDFLERSYESLVKESPKDTDQLSPEQEFEKLYPKEFIINRINEFNSIIRGITREDISKESYQKLSRYFLKLHALVLIAKEFYIKPEDFPNIETL